MAKAKEDVEVFTGELLPGMIVMWFKEAKDHSAPVPAMVQRGFNSGVCDLTIFHTHGMDKKEGVYHRSHPGLRDHFGKASDNAIRYGSWDFAPWTKDDYRIYVEQPNAKAKAKAEAESKSE